LEENVRQEQKCVREVQESLNQEQKLRRELQNRVELQSRSLTELEEKRDALQWRCSFLEDQLGEFVYVEPFTYFDSYPTETSAVMYSWSYHVVITRKISSVCLQETGNKRSEPCVYNVQT
jgi:hypothetical protein